MKNFFKHIVVLFSGFLGLLYLLQPPGLNVLFESFNMLFDWMPFVGKLDETLAVGLVVNALAFYGIDVTHFFGRRGVPKRGEPPETPGDVIDIEAEKKDRP